MGLHNQRGGLHEHGIQLIRIRGHIHTVALLTRFGDIGQLVWFEQRTQLFLFLNEFRDLLHLGSIDKRALQTHHVAAGGNQHVALADELVGARGIQDRLGIHARLHAECDTRGEVGLDTARDNVHGWTLRSNHQVDADGTGELCQTGQRLLHLASCRHDQVAELIDNDHDIRHISVTRHRRELACTEFGIVFLDITHLRHLQQVVAVVHLHAQGVERAHHLFRVGDDGIAVVGQRGQIVVLDGRIEREFHLLRIHQHELHLARMLGVE